MCEWRFMLTSTTHFIFMMTSSTFSASLALYEGNPPVTGGFPSQRPMIRSFDIFFDVCLNKRLSKFRDAGDLKRHRAQYDVIVKFAIYMHSSHSSLYDVQSKQNNHLTPLYILKYKPLDKNKPGIQNIDICVAWLNQCANIITHVIMG